jgi:hypothetical protein
MFRLGHISFFGLGLVNFLFYVTANALPAITPFTIAASWAFLIGAVTMPLCCGLMMASKRFHLWFGIPVISLLTAAVITLVEVIKL